MVENVRRKIKFQYLSVHAILHALYTNLITKEKLLSYRITGTNIP